jgi:uncharacterized protein (TIGR03067 family)
MIAHNARHSGALALVLLVLASVGVRAAQDKGDPKTVRKDGDPNLQGKWSVVSLTKRGKEVKDDALSLTTWEFQGDRVTAALLEERTAYQFRTDPTKQPRPCDLAEVGRKYLMPGIYKVEKNTLTVCYDEFSENPRPDKFESPIGSYRVLIVLRRGDLDIGPITYRELVAKVREQQLRTTHANNLKQIALAMHGYLGAHKGLPAQAIYSKDGKQPLLSWRVAILPYIEEAPLYRQFKLDEPWDSDHNKKLLAKMPRIYALVRGTTREPHSTFYQVFTGPMTPFDGNKKARIQQFRDGTSNTLLVVEAGEAVPWTKPDDIPYNPKQLPKLGGTFKGAFYAAFADGSVRAFRRDLAPESLRALITPAGGEAIGDDLDP